MINKIKADYGQFLLFPPCLEDWIPEDHSVRFINEVVNELNLEEIGIKISKAETGRPAYDERMLLKVWLYGYFKNIRSTRKLEEACREQLPLIWMTGMHYPDHTTLSNFSKANRKAMKKLFKKIVKLAGKAGLIGLVLQAVDGTKIAADVSKKQKLCKEDIKLILEVLEEKLKDYHEEVDKNTEEEKWDCRFPAKLRKKEDRKAWLEEELARLSESENSKIKLKLEKELEKFSEVETKFLNKTDLDSRMMKNGNVTEFCYNAQAARDSKSGIITAAEVVQTEADNNEGVKMLDESRENTGDSSDENLMDGGYFSGEELKEACDKGYNVLVNITKKNKVDNHNRDSEFHQSNFKKDIKNNCYICPRGAIRVHCRFLEDNIKPLRNKEKIRSSFFGQFFYLEEQKSSAVNVLIQTEHIFGIYFSIIWECTRGILKFERNKKHNHKDYEVAIYRCEDYLTCPVREKCTKDKRGRSLEISPYKDYVDAQIKKLKEETTVISENTLKVIANCLGISSVVLLSIKINFNKALLKKRNVIIEPVFGHIKHIMGFWQWTLRGIENVRAQWNLICATVNLKTMYKFWKAGEFKFA